MAAWKAGEFGLIPYWVTDCGPPLELAPGSGKLVTPCWRMHCANSSCWVLAWEDGRDVLLPLVGSYFWQALLAAWKLGALGFMPLWVIDLELPLGLALGSGKLVTPWNRMHSAYSKSWSFRLFDEADEPDPPDDAAAVVVGVPDLADPPPHAATASAQLTTSTTTALRGNTDRRGRVGSISSGELVMLRAPFVAAVAGMQLFYAAPGLRRGYVITAPRR